MYLLTLNSNSVPVKKILFLFIAVFLFLFSANAQCLQSFEYIFGNSTNNNIGYDVVDAGNSEFFMVGTSDEFSTSQDILITKMTNGGIILWSKTYGGAGIETIRKANATKDGGLVLAGQTTSFGNSQGDILYMKINASGSIVWSRKLGLGSTYGDLGMDIIETSDGGYAATGIINVAGAVADAMVVKMDASANVKWCKRFDRGDGEDAVGIIESGNNLVVTLDLQNSGFDYDGLIMEMSEVDGTIIKSMQLNPSSRGIFNPYLFKDNGSGYWISGHLIDQSSYSQMQQVIIKLDANFSITNTYAISVNPKNNNSFTGFVPLKDNSFFICESPQSSANSFIYHIGANKKVLSAKKFSGSITRRLNRLNLIGNKIVAVGSEGNSSYDDLYLTCYDSTGIIKSSCLPDTASLIVQNFSFATSSFSWPTIANVNFNNINASFTSKDVTIEKKDLCSKSCDSLLQSCGNTWLNVKGSKSGVSVGDLDISGNNVTIEATINRTSSYDNTFFGGDIISKHCDPSDVNYLLRANRAEITTSNGYYSTPYVCPIELNKTYHVAMVYNGASLKYYRNGFLLSEVACTGNMILNNYKTTFGTTACSQNPWPSEFLGFIDEVRVWKVARTQEDIRSYMDKSLPNPSSQNGLLAYYTFDDLKNEQGNNNWNGTLFTNALTNQSNPTCSSFIADSCGLVITKPAIVSADFTIPDTVCANTPVNITNLTKEGTNFYWNFNVADIYGNPEGANLGNMGGQFSLPVFTDQVYVNGNYYVFVVNNYPGGLVRLDFGNSMLNTPTIVNLGDVGGVISNNAEGIQIEEVNGKWYALIVGGYPAGGITSRIIKIDFGGDITNVSPIGTNWGNIGNLNYPIDLHVFQENSNWYGFTVNSENNTITRFNFGQNFDNPPTAVNFGNLGNLNQPTGIYAINDNGAWSVFITNNNDNSSITRLDFGNSLLNTPTAVNLGNLGNTLYRPRDIYIIKFCGELVGFIVNGLETKNDIVRLDFSNNLLSTPTAVSLGNIGNLFFPHSLSQIFRVGADLYTMIANVRNNTITRLRFLGTSNSNIPNYSDSIPPSVTYNAPGIYNIHLMVDEGLATQTSICKAITVVASPVKTPILDTAFCTSDSLVLKTLFPAGSYVWNNGSTDSIITVNQPGTYWVQSNYYGCSVRDSIITLNSVSPTVNLGTDTSTCHIDSLLLNAGNPGATYIWQDGSTAQTYAAKDSGLYYVQVTNPGGCKTKDSILINEFTAINLQVSNDTTLCSGNRLTLLANGNNIQTYSWSPSPTLSNITIKNPIASPLDTTVYSVDVTDINGCNKTDSVTINVAPLPSVSTLEDTSLCAGNNIILSTTATPGVNYSWSPSNGLSGNSFSSPSASPTATTQYIVTVRTQAKCVSSDTVKVLVNQLPAVAAATLEPLVCIGDSTSIAATSPTAISYTWSPVAGLNDASIATPTATPITTTSYRVQVADLNGCKSQDSVLVSIKQKPVFAVDPPSAGICTGEFVTLTASGGDEYTWYPPNTLSNPNAAITIATPTASTKYKVVITDNICAITDSVFATVNITALSSIDVTKSNDVDCVLGTTTLRATGGVTYNWYPPVYLSDSTIASPIAAPLATTTYHVQVTNAGGCTGIDSITVFVYKGEVENGYKLPTAFTPNNDNNNDCFGVRKWGTLSNLDLNVYDRWGVLLFHTKNPSDCWDGTYKGQSQSPGTYVYQIRAQALCGAVYRKGTIVLIR
jgi:gliding motility-associated-like protein